MKKVLLSCVASVILSACSLQSPVDAMYENISKSVSIPDKPGAEFDFTLKGLDSNKNGVRDDVEREIYLTVYRYNLINNYPKLTDMLFDVSRAIENKMYENPENGYELIVASIDNLRSYVRESNNDMRKSGEVIVDGDLSKITSSGAVEMTKIMKDLILNNEIRKKEYSRKFGILDVYADIF